MSLEVKTPELPISWEELARSIKTIRRAFGPEPMPALDSIIARIDAVQKAEVEA